ncbi:MAG: helix-turn-helix domain-containing protein [Treponema sp.]|nr:helix-turn-helix domain-containing protein [Treponema sp.]
MENTIAGRLLYEARKEKNISQKKLCYGICNQSTLTRIENGSIMPNLKQIEFFFTRLGKTVPDNIVPITKAERIRKNIEDELLRINSRNKKRLDLLEEYKKCHTSWNKLYEQFYLLQNGIYTSQFDDKLREALFIFEKAIKITIPEFSIESEIPNVYYSLNELIILNNIAHSEYYLYGIEKQDSILKDNAISRMNFIKEYFEKNFNDYEEWNMYSVVLFNLTNWLGLDGKIEEALKLSEHGVNISKTSLKYFSLHLYNNGYSYASLGQTEIGKRKLSHSLQLTELDDPFNEVIAIKADIKQQFNIDL